MEKVHTPDMPDIAPVAKFFDVDPSAMLKCIAFEVGAEVAEPTGAETKPTGGKAEPEATRKADGDLGLALVPGDREVNVYALSAALAPRPVRLYSEEDFDRHPELPRGYIGPNHPDVTVVVADPSVGAPIAWITGANEPDHHVRNCVLGRDFAVDIWADLVTIVSGDICPRCGNPLSVDRGIEVGHVFQLGAKYSEALDARFTDEAGAQHPMLMGCYGIGISRVLAAVAEEFHDDEGLAWPEALAPYDVHVILLPGRGDDAPKVLAAAEGLVEKLEARGVSVLFDDRDARPGVKFADADLLGMPVQLVVGAKGLARGVVERKVRATGARDDVAIEEV
jgi:prolyl-tRNA synthetase